ncbi:MAG: hypothetical protein E7434_01570 [Ruminococcaceae bacterium]|nr:hypothetical protein [Oscillospiraceae bacterium]
MSVNVPIMSDKTGKQLVEAQKAANVTSREIRQLASENNTAMQALMQEQNDTLKSINTNLGGIPGVFVIQATVQRDDAGAYSGVTLVSAVADIEAAIAAGKAIILQAYDAVGSKSYFASLTLFEKPNSNVTKMQFDSLTKNSPYGRPGVYTLAISNGAVAMFMISPQAHDALYVSCNITIGGTTYKTVAEALAALAAMHNG